MSLQENVSSGVLVRYGSKVVSSQLFWILAFSFLMVFAAQVAVPVEPVPFTLQTMLVLLSGAFLGSRNGAISQIIYLFLGFIGLPVFAGLSFGFATLFGPTGGYLLAFPLGAYITGRIIGEKKNLFTIVTAMFIASLVIILVGASYLSVLFHGNFKEAFFAGALIFTVWDLIKIGAAASIYYTISKRYPKLP